MPNSTRGRTRISWWRPVALSCLGVFLLLANAFALAQTADPAPDAGKQARFDIYEFRVLGNSVLDERAIDRAVSPFLGPDKSFQDVEAARTALEAAYHEKGYGTVFVDIPEQSVDDGVVRLKATEGRLHASTVTGAKYYSERQIKAAVPAAAPGTVPDLPALQSQLSAVNAATPDRSVTPVLKAGPEPGTVDLALKVDDHLPLHGSLELNNQYTPDTKPLRLTGYLSYDNLFGAMHSLSLQYQAAPQETKDAGVFAAGYVAPWGPGKLSATYIHSASNVTTVSSLGVIGKGSIYGLHYGYPVTAKPGLIEDVTAGIEYKRFAQDAGSVKSPISYAALSVIYSGSRLTDARNYTWSAGPMFGVRGVGSPAQDFANKCFECRQNYFVVRADGSVDEHLPHGFDALLRLAGQYSVTPLVSNEQFLNGGALTVRGYYEAESLGDRGLRGTLELRAPSVLPASLGLRATPFAFTDAGDIAYVSPLPAQPTSVFLASVGAGINLDFAQHLLGTLTYAHALETTPEATPASSGSTPAPVPTHTRKGDNRWLFIIKGTW